MPDYEHIRKHCADNSAVSESVIDDFVLHYAVKKDNLSRDFDNRLSKYKHVVPGMPSAWVNMIKSQYIIYRVFKKGGLIAKYLNHSAIKELLPKEKDFLSLASANPWKFSFSKILSNPSTDFYEMLDVFSADTFLLYSRSVTTTLKDQQVLTWFNLLSFNGKCWQSFGPVIGFQSFGSDDIFYFASELNDQIEDNEDLVDDMELNPVPYMMLAAGSAYPLVKSGNHEVVQVMGDGIPTSFDEKALKKKFQVEFSEGVFKITDSILSLPPHFATAYYDEFDNTTFLTALTDYGYEEFVKTLNIHGFDLPVYPDVRLHLSMLTLIKTILKKDLLLDPYAEFFEAEKSPESDETMNKLNRFLTLALPSINAGKTLDIKSLAKEAGIDPDEAAEMLQIALSKIGEMRKR